MNTIKTIKREFNDRSVQLEGRFNLLGSELKERRLKLSQTLSSISENLCSVSYLSKIENNKIIPNRMYLREICNKLDFPEEKIDTLFGLKDSLSNSVKAFINNDKNTLKAFIEKGEGISNCRYKIMKFIYFIMNKEFDKAKEASYEILRLLSSISDYDAKVYAVFYSIFLFYTQDMDNALDNLLFMEKGELSKDLRVLILKYKYYIYISTNNPLAIFEYNSFIQYLVSNGMLDMLDEIHYLMCLYLLTNGHVKKYAEIYRIINNKKYKKSLCLFSKLVFSPNMKYKIEWINDVEPFFYYLGLIKIDKSKIMAEVEALNDLSFDVDFNCLYLKYLILDTELDKYTFISNVAFPIIRRYNSGYLKDFFINELAVLCNRFMKYKLFNISYQQLKLRC